jgi:hypothetical protein
MRLQALTSAELAFLTATSAEPDALPAHLTRKLAATLSARLRLPVGLALQPAAAAADVPRTPVWQIDDALATLWLTRRLGGRRVTGAASFVPRTLIDTLDAALAEGWLDAAGQGALPSALAWQVSADLTRATLTVQLPPCPEMTRWARGAIRHG